MSNYNFNSFLLLNLFVYLSILSTGQASDGSCLTNDNGERIQIYRNPIVTEKSTDPFVYFHLDHHYYWTSTDGLDIILKKSKHLTDLSTAKSAVVFDNQESSFLFNEQLCRGINLLAPEIHSINGKWYIYFSMEVHNGSHIVQDYRNYVIEAKTRDPFGIYGTPHKLSPEDIDTYSNHGTVFEHPTGFLYFFWSGKSHYDSDSIDLYTARMSSPLQLNGYRVQVRRPTMDWEMMSGAGEILESPQVFHNFGRVFLVFSASNSSDADNCLGISSIEDWKHPLVAGNWVHNIHSCVFGRNDEEAVYGVGKVAITTSPDRKESWIVYTGSDEPGGDRSIRAERFGWIDGLPIFPAPAGTKLEHVTPSACIFNDAYKHLC